MKVTELPKRVRKNLSLLVSLSAVFTGIVFTTTVVFSAFIPATQGFFNIGESGVYLAALVAGPYVGAIAGGVGSMLADLFLGFDLFAPGTLAIKGAEGFVVGYLAFHPSIRKFLGKRWIAVAISLPLAVLLYTVGNLFYVGQAEISFLGFTLTPSFVPAVWAIVAAVLFIAVIWLVWTNPGHTAFVVAMGVGGSTMILGYFLYEQFVYSIFFSEIIALAEVPFNATQALVGMVLATYLYRAYEKVAT